MLIFLVWAAGIFLMFLKNKALMNPKWCSDATQRLSNSHSHGLQQNPWRWWRARSGCVSNSSKNTTGHRHLNTSLQFSRESRSKETIRKWQHFPALAHRFSEGCVVAQTQSLPAVAQHPADNIKCLKQNGTILLACWDPGFWQNRLKSVRVICPWHCRSHVLVSYVRNQQQVSKISKAANLVVWSMCRLVTKTLLHNILEFHLCWNENFIHTFI